MVATVVDKKKPRFLRQLFKKNLLNRYHIQIGEDTVILGSIVLPHQFNIVIGNGVVIGRDCTIYHNVTLGQNGQQYPTVGNNVIIYTGAVIVGKVHVGDNAIIGAGAIVNKDVPDNAIVAGNPAKVLRYRTERDKGRI